MSKRNIAYTRPEDPSFLKRIKEQIGYKEGPTVETKKQNVEYEADSEDENFVEPDDEQPQIVVLKPGDLTSEEFNQEKNRLEKEEKEKPADLSERIIFKSKKAGEHSTSKLIEPKASGGDDESSKSKKEKKGKSSKAEKLTDKTKLSFNDEDEDYEDSDN